MSSSGVLLIDDGDLPSLVGLALERDPQQVVLWHPHGSDAAAQYRQAAVEAHGEAFSVRQVIIAKEPATIQGESSLVAELDQSVSLLSAAAAAMRLNCPRLVWPTQIGASSSRICQTVQRANLVVALAEIGGRKNSLMIDLPLIDLGEAQIVDLAQEQGVLEQSFWPCETGSAGAPCGRCRGCRRWGVGFETRGHPWPWAAEAVAAS